MKRIWIRIGVTLGGAFLSSAVGSACAHDDTSVFIRQVLAPVIPSNGSCMFTADTTQASLSTGIADVSYPTLQNYSPEFLVGNQIISLASMNQLQTETSRVIINGAITRITDLAGDTSLLTLFANMCDGGKGDTAACATGKMLQAGQLSAPVNPFSTVESTAIEPSTGGTASYAVMSITIVDGATVDAMRAYFVNLIASDPTKAFSTSIQLLTYTKIEGQTLGGEPVESNEFEFPVTFSYGQLVANGFATEATSPSGYCLISHSAMVGQTCVAGQDVPAYVSAVVPPADIPVCLGADASTITTTTSDAGGD
jgi:hypothetical protein